MLDESEQMYEQNDEPTERPKTNYDQFDIEVVRDTYLGVRNIKAEQGLAKAESKFHGEVPISCMK